MTEKAFYGQIPNKCRWGETEKDARRQKTTGRRLRDDFSMTRVGTKEGVIWVIIGGFICLLSWRIDLGSFNEPGPGFVAFASGLSLIIIGSVMALSKTFAKRSPGAGRPRWALPKFRLFYTLLLLVGYGLVLQCLGYIVTTFLVLFGLFYDRGINRFLPSFLGSLLTVVITYLVFETWLRVQLPRGILPWW
jgi:putative tricarboxylic transport membrane protein